MPMNIENVVDTLAAHKLIRVNRVMGEWYSVFCPFHNNGQEKKPSCGVSLHGTIRGGIQYQPGNFHCFSCGVSCTLEHGIDTILKSHGIHKTGIEWLKENIPDYEEPNDFNYLLPQDTMELISNKFAIEDIKDRMNRHKTYVSEEELASYRFVVPYMYERKLTDKIINDYDIGYDAKWVPPGRKKPVPCITIPVRDRDGRTLFLCRRSIQGKIYNYPQGVTKPVFGIDKIPKGTTTVIICEGALNALTAISYGYPAVALLGTGNSYQMQQLRELGVRNYVICLDGDEAGRTATEKIKKHLRKVSMVWVMHMPDGKDANDCTPEEFKKIYDMRD